MSASESGSMILTTQETPKSGLLRVFVISYDQTGVINCCQ